MQPTKESKPILFYVAIGCVYVGLWVLGDLSKYPDTFGVVAINDIWRGIYVIVLNYIFFEHCLPFIRRKRKLPVLNILLAVPTLFLLMMFYSWGLYAWRQFGISINIYTPLKVFKTQGHAVTEQVSYSILSLLFFAVVRHGYNYIRLKNATQQLRIEKQEAELNYLKSQTNPHFLFNTLNNIYVLARDKSDLAPESILRLSKILRFMLYETSGAFIAVEDELRIISDYIALEQLRYDDSLHVNLNHNVEDMKQAVPPLLLIPLVENAFKHGVSETRERPFVDIHLAITNRQLTFIVRNSAEESEEPRQIHESIGLANLRRQLELLYNSFELSARQGRKEFIASLKINLASHV